MKITVSVTGLPRSMHPVARDEVFRIGVEAIRNACIHSGGESVSIDLRYSRGLMLDVRDSGQGFDPKLLNSGKPGHFDTTEKLAEATKYLNQFGDVVILRLRNMTALDATGMHALEQFSDRLHKAAKTLLLCGARDQPSKLISQSDFRKHVGTENVLPHVQAALARARDVQGDFQGLGRELALELEHRPL